MGAAHHLRQVTKLKRRPAQAFKAVCQSLMTTRFHGCVASMMPAIAAQDINAAGVARMTRMLSVLQPALSTLGTTGGNFRPEVNNSAGV